MNEVNNPLDARLDLVPQSPGVYLMKDTAGSVIYVGKALNLRSRLRSYFNANPQGSPKVLAMIARIADFSTIICTNELEALILESTLIKKHQPHYNILLRDDRDYPYLKVTLNETYPRLLKAFRIGSDRQEGAKYYGPYLAGDVFHALQALQVIFPMKTCRRQLPRDIGKERPCLNFHIGRCIGPCRGDVPASSYRAVMESICRFLEGRYDGLLSGLKNEMAEAAERLRFEEAGLLRDRIQSLEKLMNRQQVVSNKAEDKDVLGIARNGSEICLQKLEIRQGRLVASAAFFWPENDQPDIEVLESFIIQHYPDAALVPPEILVPAESSDQAAITDFLRQLRNGRCQLRRPIRGDDSQLLKMASGNAEESLRRHTLMAGGGQTALQEVMQLLSRVAAQEKPIHRIEAIDISNTGEDDKAASLVVFQEGKPLRQQYRLFKHDKLAGTDDYEAMRETLRRRLRHLGEQEFGSRPDLILVDGGLGHVSAALQVLTEMNLDLAVAGMVKDERHRTRGLALTDGTIIELRPPKDPEYFALRRLLTAIQDEAHRFAGQYRKKLHKKRNIRFTLEGIKGIGPSRRRLLLTRFETIKGVGEASLADLQSLTGLGEAAALAVYRHFHPEA